MVPGPLGSCQFLQLPWSPEESLDLSTSLLHPGVSLSAFASPTGKNCRPHWMEQTWGSGCSQCGWPRGRKELGTVLEGLRGTPSHGRVGSCFCPSPIPGDPLYYDPLSPSSFSLPSLPWTFVFCDPVVTSGLPLSPAYPVLLARLGWAYGLPGLISPPPGAAQLVAQSAGSGCKGLCTLEGRPWHGELPTPPSPRPQE